MARAADVDGGGTLGIVLRTVDVGPCCGVQNEIGRLLERGRRKRDVPLGMGQPPRGGKGLSERVTELAARPRDQDAASRSDRIGDFVLQRSTTRGSSQASWCSSGSAGSYSSVT